MWSQTTGLSHRGCWQKIHSVTSTVYTLFTCDIHTHRCTGKVCSDNFYLLSGFFLLIDLCLSYESLLHYLHNALFPRNVYLIRGQKRGMLLLLFQFCCKCVYFYLSLLHFFSFLQNAILFVVTFPWWLESRTWGKVRRLAGVLVCLMVCLV